MEISYNSLLAHMKISLFTFLSLHPIPFCRIQWVSEAQQWCYTIYPPSTHQRFHFFSCCNILLFLKKSNKEQSRLKGVVWERIYYKSWSPHYFLLAEVSGWHQHILSGLGGVWGISLTDSTDMKTQTYESWILMFNDWKKWELVTICLTSQPKGHVDACWSQTWLVQMTYNCWRTCE